MRVGVFTYIQRIIAFIGIVVGCLIESFIKLGSVRKNPAFPERAQWLSKWSRKTLETLNVTVTHEGTVPSSGFIVSNHLTYLDILVIATSRPIVFLSKYDVIHWPIFGTCARCAGTLFIKRDKKADVKRVAGEFDAVLNTDTVICLFPEGTSTDGHQLLPFHSSLLAPLEVGQWPVTPVWIGYKMEKGAVEDDVCYWRDMTFFPHLLKLFSRRTIQAKVVFGEPLAGPINRKEAAKILHERVLQIAIREGRIQPESTPPKQA